MTDDQIKELIERLDFHANVCAMCGREQDDDTREYREAAQQMRFTCELLSLAIEALSSLLKERGELREALECAQIYIDRLPTQNMLAFQLMEKTIKDALQGNGDEK